MALPQLPAYAQHQLGQGVNKENPLTRVYAKRAANRLAALFVYALSPMEINIPLLAHGFTLSYGEEPYRAIIFAPSAFARPSRWDSNGRLRVGGSSLVRSLRSRILATIVCHLLFFVY